MGNIFTISVPKMLVAQCVHHALEEILKQLVHNDCWVKGYFWGQINDLSIFTELRKICFSINQCFGIVASRKCVY